MDKNGDATFCQVSRPAEQDKLDVKQLASDVGGITIKDERSNGSGNDKGLLWKDKLPDDTSKKQVKVGSLSYNVIDASAPKQSSGLGIQIVLGDAGPGASAKSLKEQKVPAKKPASRAKVPFEKGYSQMDWFKLTRTHPDLAGLKGQSNRRLISMNEVKQHKTEGSVWTVLKGHVYNISPYMKFHPGGEEILMKAVGKDCTLLFNKYHAWVNFEFMLEKCLVGTLDDSK